MSKHSKAKKTAKKLMKDMADGPCVMLAYTWANAVDPRMKQFKKGSFMYDMPIMDKQSGIKAVPYYAVIRTDRTGHEIYSLPGGGQDVLFFRRGILQSVELGKASVQADYLRGVLGVDVPKHLNDERFIRELARHDDITDLTIETAFNAAAREAEEEHGWSYTANRDKIVSAPVTIEHEALLKRSYDYNPPRPVSFPVSLVEVETFEGTVPWLANKVEGKMKGRKGTKFYEQGNFACLDDLRDDLDYLKARLKSGKLSGKIFDQQVVSTQSRIDMIEQIEATHIYPKRTKTLAL